MIIINEKIEQLSGEIKVIKNQMKILEIKKIRFLKVIGLRWKKRQCTRRKVNKNDLIWWERKTIFKMNRASESFNWSLIRKRESRSVCIYVYTHTYTYIHTCICTYIHIYIYEIIAKNFKILVKDINLQIQETQKTHS